MEVISQWDVPGLPGHTNAEFTNCMGRHKATEISQKRCSTFIRNNLTTYMYVAFWTTVIFMCNYVLLQKFVYLHVYMKIKNKISICLIGTVIHTFI